MKRGLGLWQSSWARVVGPSCGMVLHQGRFLEVCASQRGMGTAARLFHRVVTFNTSRKGCQGVVLIARLVQSSPHSILF